MRAIWLRTSSELRCRWRATFRTARPPTAIALAIPATLIVANLVAAIPGRVASRIHPAVILRTE
jgi:ABC-type lipoprotein release transport system permease subunit